MGVRRMLCSCCCLCMLLPVLIMTVMIKSKSVRDGFAVKLAKSKADNWPPSKAHMVADYLLIISDLVAGGADFRRVIFFQCLDASGGFETIKAEGGFAPYRSALAGLTYNAVADDQMNPTQARGPYFGGGRLGVKIPDECMPAELLLFKSSGSREHTELRAALHDAIMSGSLQRGNAQPIGAASLVLPPPERAEPLHNASSTMVAGVVGMTLYHQMFGLPAGEWSQPLADIFSEYGAIGPICGVGVPIIKDLKKGRVLELRQALEEHAERSEHMQAFMASATERGLDAESAKRQVMFGFLFAALGGTAQLTNKIIDRIKSDPPKYLAMWQADKRAFMLENARVDPPVTSYTSVTGEDKELKMMGVGVRVASGTPQQMVIAVAHADPAVFGGDAQSEEYARSFDPTRENLDKILSWNGVEGEIKKAPRGCPGHDLSQAVVPHVVDYFLQPLTAEGGGARASAKAEL